MYKVIIVDDEPTAIEFIEALIKRKLTDFVVTAVASNGRECLDLIETHKPDIVISDIKMPVMDGIELIRHINSDYPQIMTLLISGYEEFEYARQALKYNAVDYIKKPIIPRIFTEVMDRMKEHLDCVFGEERNRVIRSLAKGVDISNSTLEKYFPQNNYYAILIRKNGLPRRFLGTQEIEVFSEVYESIIVYGRDEMESLYLITKEIMIGSDKHTLTSYIQNLLSRESNQAYYTTVIATQNPISRGEFNTGIRRLYRELDSKTIIGKNQVIYLEDATHIDSSTSRSCQSEKCGPKYDSSLREQIARMLKKLEHLLSLRQYDRARQEIGKLFDFWKAANRTQLEVEELVHQLLFLLRNFGIISGYSGNIDYDIEDAFYNAENMDALKNSVDQLLFGETEEHLIVSGKIDTPDFFEKIRNYIRSNMTEQLSLQSVSQEFGISQTYLSKMFRKYEDRSFNNFLTAIRMDEAKRLMVNDPDLFIKDIAAMVGYNDQFYFSRIFRSFTGMCPSDYLQGDL